MFNIQTIEYYPGHKGRWAIQMDKETFHENFYGDKTVVALESLDDGMVLDYLDVTQTELPDGTLIFLIETKG